MRDYLFRGKWKDNGEWVEGCGIIATENWVSIFTVIDDIDENSSEVNEIEVIPETVGQYTGLKDKNDTKIFEGDIVLVPYVDPIFKCAWNDTSSCERAIVKYCNGMFYVEYIESDDKFTLSAMDGYMKIIGNIYDNPELLGGNNNVE